MMALLKNVANGSAYFLKSNEGKEATLILAPLPTLFKTILGKTKKLGFTQT